MYMLVLTGGTRGRFVSANLTCIYTYVYMYIYVNIYIYIYMCIYSFLQGESEVVSRQQSFRHTIALPRPAIPLDHGTCTQKLSPVRIDK